MDKVLKEKLVKNLGWLQFSFGHRVFDAVLEYTSKYFCRFKLLDADEFGDKCVVELSIVLEHVKDERLTEKSDNVLKQIAKTNLCNQLGVKGFLPFIQPDLDDVVRFYILTEQTCQLREYVI